ncbi:RSP_7527 family protein [Amphritea balenae]|uniref:Uncharacterized protein n=1 Tax=Amphritea balenae TaxID=452629 RepID=A0A3P1SPD4_9GAMM|nr:hypothetical protein [Amphritea balenae]RRC98889.1 hypothetical protein EHS89_11935 [Amphritea balenae]GGK62571.1 hypothetical protein GCM10007941_10910 [Amphritea balenae]
MQNYYVDIKLDKHDNIDTDYYIGQAHTLRGEALAELGTSISSWFKNLKAKMFARQGFIHQASV